MGSPERVAAQSEPLANTVHLVAQLLARDALRWSPGGIAILGVTLAHRSLQFEAGIEREVVLEMPARAAGALAEQFDRVALGGVLAVRGFLAPRNRSAKGVVLHLTNFELLNIS